MNVIVDVQGFKSEENEFIPKEIAIMYKGRVQVLLIKPPRPFYDLTRKERLQVAWIEKNRGINWNEGFVPYFNYQANFGDFFTNKSIFTKGNEKVLWIKDIFRISNVFNLESKNCPSLLTLYNNYSDSSDITSCMYHTNICALKNVFCLNKWCEENQVFCQ